MTTLYKSQAVIWPLQEVERDLGSKLTVEENFEEIENMGHHNRTVISYAYKKGELSTIKNKTNHSTQSNDNLLKLFLNSFLYP